MKKFQVSSFTCSYSFAILFLHLYEQCWVIKTEKPCFKYLLIQFFWALNLGIQTSWLVSKQVWMWPCLYSFVDAPIFHNHEQINKVVIYTENKKEYRFEFFWSPLLQKQTEKIIHDLYMGNNEKKFVKSVKKLCETSSNSMGLTPNTWDLVTSSIVVV